MKDQRLYQKLNPQLGRVEINYLKMGESRIRYADVGNPENRMVLFIHGAPGSLEAFTGFLKDPRFRQNFRMIALDRPGYGHSDPGNPVISLRTQATLLQPLLVLNQHPEKPILAGHSYGGPVAASLAVQSPDLVGGILLVGAAMDPEHEKTYWISHLLRLPWISVILPPYVLSAHAEKESHVEELKKVSDSWREIRVPVTILHGKNDWIVPVENAYFTNNLLTNARKRLVIKEWTGHLIPWTHPGQMKQEILIMVESD